MGFLRQPTLCAEVRRSDPRPLNSNDPQGGSIIERTFDRVPQWDDRNLDYTIRALIGAPELQEKIWDLPERLDQGNEGACVGFGWTHELYAEPDRVEGIDPFEVYNRAKQIDEWPGESYSGTSVLAGAKVVQELGHLVEYRWALDVDDVLATLSAYGPVVIGINWFAGMENTDKRGFVHVTGRVRGGHCVILRGLIKDPVFGWVILGTNSWGPRWGQGGDFKLMPKDLAILMDRKNQGEACVPVVRVQPEPVPDPQPEPVPDPEPEPTVPPHILQMLELFAYEHLPEHLQVISKQFHDLAWNMAQTPTQRVAEQTTCLRKLLEAKDCAVRTAVPLGEIGSNSPPIGG